MVFGQGLTQTQKRNLSALSMVAIALYGMQWTREMVSGILEWEIMGVTILSILSIWLIWIANRVRNRGL